MSRQICACPSVRARVCVAGSQSAKVASSILTSHTHAPQPRLRNPKAPMSARRARRLTSKTGRRNNKRFSRST